MTFLSWLASSETERQRALEFVSLFDEPGTVDEIGIGVIRDAIADQLSPGTSTVQTRARYFLFVPWTYRELERRQVSSADIAERARRLEIATILVLAETAETGVIGRRAGRALKFLPSGIYWTGLGTWGIRRFQGSRAQYHRSLDAYYDAMRGPRTEAIESPAVAVPPSWDPELPEPPEGFPRSLDSLSLRTVEALYLRDRIMAEVPGTMLAYLVDAAQVSEAVELPWMHPQRAHLTTGTQLVLDHAQCFSEAIHGAALLYNLLVAELLPNPESREAHTADYRQRLAEWSELMASRRHAHSRWDRATLWRVVGAKGARVGALTRRFVDAWLDLVVVEGRFRDVGDVGAARALVADRERALKKGQARLENPRARELWRGASGAAQLSYRWPITQQIVADIREPLES